MVRGTKNQNYVKFMDISDVHDTLKADKKSGIDYFPKHTSYAKLAEEQGAEFIINKGDNFDEDEMVDYMLQDIDGAMRLYSRQRLSLRETKISQLGRFVMHLGNGGGIEEVEKKYRESEDPLEKRKLEKIIDQYKLYDEEDIHKAMIESEKVKEEILPSLKDKIDEAKFYIVRYYREALTPALIEAYSDYSGKILMVQGNHDPDVVLEELQKKAGDKFIVLDYLDNPYKNKNFNIAGISNIEKHNLFPKTSNFEIPELYDKAVFGVTPSEMEKLRLELEADKNLSEEEKEHILQEESKSVVAQRFSKPEFDRIDFLFTHNGPNLGGPAMMGGSSKLRAKVEQDKDDKDVLNKDGTYKFERSLGESDMGLDQIIMQKMQENKLGMVSSGHIHRHLDPAEIKIQSMFGEMKTIAARTDPDNAFLHYAEKDEETNKINLKSRRVSIKQDKKAA